MAYLWKREILSPGVYHARRLACRSGGRRLQAVSFVLNPAHPQYAGHLSDAERVAILQTARGKSGTSREYLRRSNAALRAAGIPCGRLAALERALARSDARTARTTARRAGGGSRRQPSASGTSGRSRTSRTSGRSGASAKPSASGGRSKAPSTAARRRSKSSRGARDGSKGGR